MRLEISTVLPGFGTSVLYITDSLLKNKKFLNSKLQGRKSLGTKRKLSDFDQLFERVDW